MDTIATPKETLYVSVSDPVHALPRRIAESSPSFVRVDHAGFSGRSLIAISRSEPESGARGQAKAMLVELAKHGYVLYMVQDGVSRFMRQNEVSSVWHRIKNGEFKMSDGGVVYSISPPKIEPQRAKLLVMFSTIHDDMYSPSLLRYFMQNFPTIQKFLPPETTILRIADLGGVTGAFYLDTVYAPNHAANVQTVIRQTADQLGVDHDDIVLYGASKGGTGALYQSLMTGWKCVAVDPIVSDEHYEREFNDSHFTGSGMFPESKQDVFTRAVKNARDTGLAAKSHGKWAVICSERSPQFPYIKEILIDQISEDALFVNSLHPDITDHPHVGMKTVNWQTMMLNMLFYGMSLETGVNSGI